jgi:hypothetical protein
MDNALKNLFAVTDLRNRVLFTLALLGVYRVGAHITTPGVNIEALEILAQQAGAGAPQDHAVHAVPDAAHRDRPGDGHRDLDGALDRHGRRPAAGL